VTLRYKKRYWRLIKLVAGLGLFSSLCGFVVLYFWDYGFAFPPLTMGLLRAPIGDALANGMLYGGVFTAFPVWLASETFGKPKTLSSQASSKSFRGA